MCVPTGIVKCYPLVPCALRFPRERAENIHPFILKTLVKDLIRLHRQFCSVYWDLLGEASKEVGAVSVQNLKRESENKRGQNIYHRVIGFAECR